MLLPHFHGHRPFLMRLPFPFTGMPVIVRNGTLFSNDDNLASLIPKIKDALI